jgi:chromatin structure-remodeling complex subunit RSC1/2
MNERIPLETREQFQRDEMGRVLFFTQPPLDREHRGVSNESAGLGHSVRYLADRAREIDDRRAKRKARDELRKEEERKKLEIDEEAQEKAKKELLNAAGDVLINWVAKMNRDNEVLLKQYEGWSTKDAEIDKYTSS